MIIIFYIILAIVMTIFAERFICFVFKEWLESWHNRQHDNNE